MFFDSVETILAKPLVDQEHWVQQTKRHLPAALRRDQDRVAKRQHAITKYFQDREMARQDGVAGDSR